VLCISSHRFIKKEEIGRLPLHYMANIKARGLNLAKERFDPFMCPIWLLYEANEHIRICTPQIYQRKINRLYSKKNKEELFWKKAVFYKCEPISALHRYIDKEFYLPENSRRADDGLYFYDSDEDGQEEDMEEGNYPEAQNIQSLSKIKCSCKCELLSIHLLPNLYKSSQMYLFSMFLSIFVIQNTCKIAYISICCLLYTDESNFTYR